MFLDNLKPLTFTFFIFKVPNLKQFFWNIGAGNMSESYREAKAVLDNVKTSAWSYFKFGGEEIDKSFVHCKLCLKVHQNNKMFSEFYSHLIYVASI